MNWGGELQLSASTGQDAASGEPYNLWNISDGRSTATFTDDPTLYGNANVGATGGSFRDVVYTDHDGRTATFVPYQVGTVTFYRHTLTVWPSGLTVKYNHDGSGVLTSVVSSRGYALRAESGGVLAMNTTVTSCDPTGAASCAGLPGTELITFDTSIVRQFSIVNQKQEITRFATPDSQTLSITLPGSSVPDLTYHYDKLSDFSGLSVSRPSGSWHYAFAFNIKNSTGTDYSTVTTITDPTGLATTITNFAKSIKNGTFQFQWARPQSIKQGGRTWTYTYDRYGRTLTETKPEGDYDSYAYDVNGNILSEVSTPKPGSVGVSATTRSATYVNDGVPARTNKMLTFTDARAATTSYEYDNNGFLTKQTFPQPVPTASARQDSYTYQSPVAPGGGTIELISSKTEAVGTPSAVTTSYSYAGSANLLPTAITKGAGAVSAMTLYSYTPLGDVDTVTDPVGNRTRTYHDELRRVVGIVGPDPDGAGPLLYPASKMVYNPHGLVTQIVRGTVTDQGDSPGTSLVALETHNTAYDPADRLNHTDVMANGVTVSATDFAYDAANRPTTTTVRMLGQGADRVTLNSYDVASSTSSGLLLSTTTAFNAADGSASTVSYAYTGNQKRKSLTDGDGHVTNYAYDGLDRLQTTTYADAKTEVLGYDNNANITSVKRRDGTTVSYGFDKLNRKTGRTATGLSNSYDYDPLDRLTAATGGSYNVARTYDVLGRMLTETTGSFPMINRYDAAGRRIYEQWVGTLSAGGTPQYSFDYLATGALSHILDSYGVAHATFTYDDLGRQTGVTRLNGPTTTMAYGSDLRLASITHTMGAGAGNLPQNTVSFTYRYNPAGQMIERSTVNDSYIFTPPRSTAAPTVSTASTRSVLALPRLATTHGATRRASVARPGRRATMMR